jgi:hypothetical protein
MGTHEAAGINAVQAVLDILAGGRLGPRID